MIVIQNDTNYNYDNLIKKVIKQLLLHFDKQSEVVVKLVTQSEIIQLNKDYRDKNQPTNVLAFVSEVPPIIADVLGDIIICLDVVKRESIQQHKAFEDHLTHILLHGFLHLLGYNHIKYNEAEVMESLEIEILANWQIDNPYIIQSK